MISNMDSMELAKAIRMDVLEMTHRASASHVGSCLSVADILAVLYGGVMKVRPSEPKWEGRDRLILSKGHACAALYATLAEMGFFPKELLTNFYQSRSELISFYQGDFELIGHANHEVSGVDVSTGALGHGLSIGCGLAWRKPYTVFVILGDGDCQEGQTWEAAMFAAHHRLSNLVVIVDYNKMQALGRTSEVLQIAPLVAKWSSFGWCVKQVNGHDITELASALTWIHSCEPLCVIAETVKGKGVSFMENKLEWHYRHPNGEELEKSLRELQ